MSYRSATRTSPCPVCQKPDWCRISDDGVFAVCKRVREGSIRETPGGAWLHVLKHRDRPRESIERAARPKRIPDFSEMVRHRLAETSRDALARAACALGLPDPEPLHRLDAFIAGRLLCFPMRDHRGRIVGIRKRAPSGRKWAEEGGTNGLFLPMDLEDKKGFLLLPEGPTDTAALLSIGLAAVGRPDCSGGADFLAKLCLGENVVVVADPDGPGRAGAERLAGKLCPVAETVRVIEPPPGFKDVRVWITQGGAHREDIDNLIMLSSPWGIYIA